MSPLLRLTLSLTLAFAACLAMVAGFLLLLGLGQYFHLGGLALSLGAAAVTWLLVQLVLGNSVEVAVVHERVGSRSRAPHDTR